MKNNPTKFAFFGTPQFAVGVLSELEKAGLLPSLVVTAPDKPRGRKLVVTPPEVKVWAEKRNVPVLQPEKLDDEFLSELKTKTYELFIVAAYGKFFPPPMLQIPARGTLVWHPSLLPKLRGPSPILSSILLGEKPGVTIMLMDEQMDHGPIIAQRERVIKDFTISPPRGSELENDLAHFGGNLLAETIPQWISGEIQPAAQDHEHATYCKKITKEDGLIDLHDDALKNFRKIQAFNVWPRAYFWQDVNGKKMRVIVTDAELREGTLVIKKVLPEGQNEMGYEEFLKKELEKFQN